MTVRVTPEMRERIDAKKIDMEKENYIYESPDGGKTIYRSEIYDDVSGVKIDTSEQLKLQFDEFEADKKAINTLSKRVLEILSLYESRLLTFISLISLYRFSISLTIHLRAYTALFGSVTTGVNRWGMS